MSNTNAARGIWSVLIGLAFLTSVSTAGAKELNWWPFNRHVTQTTATVPTDISGRAGYLQSADKVIGTRVENPRGERLGTIKDLVINEDHSKVNFVLLSSGTKLYPVPWRALDTGQKYYTLNMSKSSLTSAPVIKSSEISRLGNPEFRRTVDDFYSKMMPGMEGKHLTWMKENNFYKCSTVLGTTIRDPQGTRIARLSDMVFDVRNGKVDYGLARFGGIAGIRTKTAAVPWQAITLNLPQDRAAIKIDKTALNSAVLAKGDINRLNEPMFVSRINQTFGTSPIYGYVPPKRELGSTAAWLEGSEYNKMFNPNSIVTVEGTIKSIDTFTPEKGSLDGLKLKIETPSNEKMVIHAGPQAYYMSQKVKFNEGDRVTVTGSKVKSGLKEFIMASEIKRGSDTFKIRDESGKPLWKPEMLERQVTPPAEK